MTEDMAARVGEWMDALCLTHPDRRVGGPGVAAGNELFGDVVTAASWDLERLPFDCVDWEHGEASLVADSHAWSLHAGPYSPGFSGDAVLRGVSSAAELEAVNEPGCVLFIHGELAAEQITPRNYPFYQTEEHKALLAELDRLKPAAIVAATDRTPMAAALRPFPLFEDADLGFPSAYLLDAEATDIPLYFGQPVHLEIDSRQVPSWSEQLIARLPGARADRVAVSAHIDSRFGTPGALDNATGVCVLLALAQMLGDTLPPVGVELLPFNGEDNFGAYGEMRYLHACGEGLTGIVLAINVDAAARRGDETEVSFYGADGGISERVRARIAEHDGISEGPSWPMSDHMVFAMRGVPAAAITSAGLYEIAAEVAHTPRDVPELADPAVVVGIARFIADVIRTM